MRREDIKVIDEVIEYVEKYLKFYEEDYIRWHDRWAADQTDTNWHRRRDASMEYNGYRNAVDHIREFRFKLLESAKSDDVVDLGNVDMP